MSGFIMKRPKDKPKKETKGFFNLLKKRKLDHKGLDPKKISKGARSN